jgi:CheY-like chemotaxis protein
LKRILLIDDNPIDLMIHEKLARRMWGENTVVIKKTGGAEALSYLDQCDELPDLTLLDIKMPEMDGFAFVNAPRQRPFAEQLPIFMVSSSIDPTDKHQAREDNLVVGFLEKPLSLEQLKDQVSK